jgi:adenylate cyclase
MSMSDNPANLSSIDETSRAFPRELARETLLAERLRVIILAAVYGLLLAFALVGVFFFPRPFYHLFGRRFPLPTIAALLAVGAAYALIIWVFLRLAIRTRRTLSAFPRYLNALIETGFPAAAIVLLAGSIGPAYVLQKPVYLLYFLVVALAALHLNPGLCAFTGLVAALETALLALYYARAAAEPPLTASALLEPAHYLAGALILLATGIITALATSQIKHRVTRALQAAARRSQIAGMFRHYISPPILDRLLDQQARTAQIDLQTRYVCVMFLDIKDFTRFAAEHESEEIVAYLSMLFETMFDIVNRSGGIIFKFLGDGFLAAFGEPFTEGDGRIHATAAAMEIVEWVNARSSSGAIPPTHIGIGIHAGEVETGCSGPPEDRPFTVGGDLSNLASRIEQVNKKFGSQLLVSDEVWQGVGDRYFTGGIALSPIAVEGHAEPVGLYRLA